MASDWIYEKIGNLPIILIDSDRSKRYPKRSEFKDGGVPFLNAESISSGRFDQSKVNYISIEKYEEITKGRLENNDLILTMRGNGVGDVGFITGKDIIGLINAQMLILRSSNETIDSKFLYYEFISPQFKNELRNFVSGSAQPQLTMGHLRHIPLSIPPLSEQKAIAHILGSLDDKIELNRQMNETLEAMAQALFKSWFVDFDPVIDNALAAGNAIPDEFIERAEQRKGIEKKENSDIQDLFPDEFEFTEEMGWIPRGWGVSEVGKILNRLKTKVKYKKDDVSDYGKVPVYEQGSGILLGFHDNEPDIKASNEDPAFIFGDHTCVTKLSLESFSISANVIPLKGKDYPTIWVYYAVQDKQSFEEYRRHWMEFIIKPVISPPVELTEIFSKHVESFGAKQMKIQYQNSDLAKLRDTLLPRLMSGELRVDDL